MNRRGTVVLVAAILALSCTKSADDAEAGPSARQNLLVNPGFEGGRHGWSRHESELWGDFEIATSPTLSGQRSLRLELNSAEQRSRSKVFGAYQELSARPFPERVTGSYRVEHWQNAVEGAALYLQVVVVVMEGGSNYQIRYYLAGAPERAISVSNAKVEIVSGDPPRQGAWVQFDLPIRRDFERLWGIVPSDYDTVRFLFEARWDNLPRDAGPALRATVYYDDLSVLAYDDAIDR